jgi:hypothetical protein
VEPIDLSGLDLDDDPAYHARAAHVERAARVLVGAVLVAAALGLFGGAGPLLKAEAAGSGGFGVRYDRFGRLDAPLHLSVTLPPGTDALALMGDLSPDVTIESVSPRPTREEATSSGIRLTVVGGQAALTLRPLRPGRLRGAVRLDDGRTVPVALFVYP